MNAIILALTIAQPTVPGPPYVPQGPPVEPPIPQVPPVDQPKVHSYSLGLVLATATKKPLVVFAGASSRARQIPGCIVCTLDDGTPAAIIVSLDGGTGHWLPVTATDLQIAVKIAVLRSMASRRKQEVRPRAGIFRVSSNC